MAELLTNFLPRFERLTKNAEHFLSIQDKTSTEVTDLLKNLYDFTKDTEDGKASHEALPELIVDGFDQEQIWQELELQNNDCNESLVADIATLVASKDRLTLLGNDVDDKSEPDDASEVLSEDEVENMDMDEDEDEDLEKAMEENKNKRKKRKALGRVSEVDDKFFKLCEMEEFLKKEEKDQGDQHDSSDESIDLFLPSDDEEDENKIDVHYADFFDDPYDGMEKDRKQKLDEDIDGTDDDDDDFNFEQEENEDEKTEEEEEEEQEEDEDVGEEEREDRMESISSKARLLSDSDDSGDDSQLKSSLEARQERIKLRIAQLEEQALAEKPWQMKGEVSGSSRPQNSMLEEAVDFDLVTRPAPVMTEQSTMRLEDIIMQRVKDKAWDDVVKKVKPVEQPYEYKKRLVLDQEKSKLSLAEVYEQEYIKQREAAKTDGSEEKQEEEEPAEHKEIRSMMSSLFAKLDALSNFHYTPRAPAPELKIVSNMPAITLEEVTPAATSDAALLAPEEIKAQPKGDIIGKGERTATDKKRAHRKKKAAQRNRKYQREKREKLVEKLRPGLGNKYSKEAALRDLEKVTKSSNVTTMDTKGGKKAVQSSTAFFNQLQDEVKTLIKNKTSTKNTEKTSSLSAKKLKL